MFLIKGLLYGKSLKQLFIIGLISCFILLGSSFVSAGYTRQIGVYGYNPYNQSIDIAMLNKGQMLTQNLGDTRKILFLSNNTFFFWGYNGIPYIATINGKKQGFATHYFNCPELQGNETVVHGNGSNSILGNCPSSVITSGSINVFSNFLNSLTNNDYFFFNQGSGYPVQNYFCISSSQYHSSLCFNGDYVDTNTSYGFTNQGWDSINSSFLYDPPSYTSGGGNSGNSFHVYTGSRLRGMLGTEGEYTNLDMVHGFEGIGLFSDLCYGGFPIDNIFDPSESFEDFTGYKAGQGATIFDLYSLYTGFSSMNQFLNTILTRYQNKQINSFKTEPKALLMVGSQLNVAGVKTSYIAEYCDLYLNSDYREVYTGNTVDSVRVKNYLNNQFTRNILRTSSGENITMQTTNNVGIFSSGDSVEFDPDTFFSNIMDEITTKLNNPTKGGAVGLLPGYIIVALLGIVFIRLISH